MTCFRTIVFCMIMVGSTFLPAQPAGFSSDSAYAYLEHLAVDIGHRVMGSRQEREALHWAAAQFRRFGADSVYVQEMRKAGFVNTHSGTAVGIFKGEIDSIIVVGGHIDTDRWGNPGANDNASGTACTIELARIWSQRPHRYTLVFCAFGGEEQNLRGSRHFVQQFEHIDRVALMFSIDMAGSEGWLVPFIGIKSHQAPKWLVEDSYHAEAALGYSDLEYPTHFFNINNALGGAGSDHMPFLELDIPAIDYTSGINVSPIHTLNDRMEFISQPMLARSGLLVDRLLTRYDREGIPAKRKDFYMLHDTVLGRFYVPLWLLYALNVLAVIAGVALFLQMRKFRMVFNKDERPRVPGLKVALMVLITAIFANLGEAVMQMLTGLRYPWMVHFNDYMWFAGICSLLGVWVALQLSRRWRNHPDPYVYGRWAIITLVIQMALFAVLSINLAIYPAVVLLLFALAMNIPHWSGKLAAALLMLLPMFLMMMMEALPLIGRSIALGANMPGFIADVVYSAVLVLVLFAMLLPAAFALVAVVNSEETLLNAARTFRRPPVGVAATVLAAAFGAYLLTLPAYNNRWKASLRATTAYNSNSGKSMLRLSSSEYLNGVELSSGDTRRSFRTRTTIDSLPLGFSADWLTVGSPPARQDSAGLQLGGFDILTSMPWQRLEVNFAPDSGAFVNFRTELAYRHEGNRYQLIWYADPPDSVHCDVNITLAPGQHLIRKVRATYPQGALPVAISSPHHDVLVFTEVIYIDTSPPPGNP